MSDNRALKLLEALSGVEEDLLERCERAVISEATDVQEETEAEGRRKVVALAHKLKQNFQKNSWRYGSAVAAVLCIAVVGLASLGGLRMSSMNDAAQEVMYGYTTADMSATGGGMAGNEGVAPESASTAAIYYATSENLETDSAIGGADNGVDSTSGTSIGQDLYSNVEKEEEKSKSENGTNAAQNGDSEKLISGESEEGSSIPNAESSVRQDELADGLKKYTYVEVTEAEARAHEIFGAYVPTELPEGYVLEGAYVNGEGEEKALMVSWSKGMDSIMVNITLPKEAPGMVDVTKTETYDEYLYEIPHAETVPEEYREVFNQPVCGWEDFTLEFVEKRMISRGEDAGDTDTPRGNFSVLYPDGVLVYFNGRGTAEEIWEMFASMQETKTGN